MNGPTTYATWASLLDRFGSGDDTALEELARGSFVLDAGTAERFYNRVDAAYKSRKKLWLDKFNRLTQSQNIKSVNDFSIMLRNAKQNAGPLVRFAAMPSLPEDLRTTFQKDLNDFFADIQKSLKDSASRATRERDQMLILLRTFTINDIPQDAPVHHSSQSLPAENTTPGRKIIF
jgi:hypothetical protein